MEKHGGSGWHPSLPDAPYLSRLLNHLLLLADTHLIEAAITRIPLGGKAYQREDNPALLAVLALLPDAQARQLLAALIQQRAADG